MPLCPDDLARLSRALQLAEDAIGRSDPNPRVGCVLADRAGAVVAEGSTLEAGGPHAEVVALRQAAERGCELRGGTAWVSLEPCAHHGRTPPCCDALIAAGLARVVVATADPFPQVAGAGIARLRAAGVAVDVADDGPITRAARELNIGFFSRVLRGKPWVRLKVAASLDGRTALTNGLSQWITGEAARIDTHRWRRRASAVLTGIGTAAADNPRLDVRHVATARQPLRVVVDSQLRLSPQAALLDPPGQALVVSAAALQPQGDALRARGAEWITLPGADGRVDLAALLPLLAQRGVNELHVEAGATLNAALLRAGLVDEVLAYLAPKVLGPGRGIVEWPALQALSDGVALRFEEVALIGDDLRLRARVPGCDRFVEDGGASGTARLP